MQAFYNDAINDELESEDLHARLTVSDEYNRWRQDLRAIRQNRSGSGSTRRYEVRSLICYPFVLDPSVKVSAHRREKRASTAVSLIDLLLLWMDVTAEPYPEHGRRGPDEGGDRGRDAGGSHSAHHASNHGTCGASVCVGRD